MWIKIYRLFCFISIVLFFVCSFFLLDMLFMTIKMEKSLVLAFYSYINWIYLYISAFSLFLINYGFYVYMFIFIIFVFYSYKKYKKLSIHSFLYAVSCIFSKITNIFYINFKNSQLSLVSESSKLDLLVKYNYTIQGIVVNICTIFVVIILVIFTNKYIKKEIGGV